MDYKQFSYDLKDLDEKQGVVIAYANAYDNEDSDGDISAKGSFVKTAKENYKRLRVLKDHDKRISLGVPLALDPYDSYGLLTTTKFNLKKEVARDMFTDIILMKDNGLNSELSIGYDVVERSKSNKAVINEYRLWEWSFLTSWAANELAIVGDVKNIKNVSNIISFLEKAYNLDYSDPRLRSIEESLKSLTQGPSNKPDTQKKPIDAKFKEQILSTFNKF